MKNQKMLYAPILVLTIIFLGSCEAIAGIFKAGIWFGIFLVLVIFITMITLFMKARQK